MRTFTEEEASKLLCPMKLSQTENSKLTNRCDGKMCIAFEFHAMEFVVGENGISNTTAPHYRCAITGGRKK